MTVNISCWSELREGDVWLGAVIEEVGHSHITLARADKKPMRGASAIDCNPFTLDTLIQAGNNTVERKPKKVECVERVILGNSCGTYINLSLYDMGELPVGTRVKVTIEPI